MSITALFYLFLFFILILRSLGGKPINGLYAYIISIYMYAPGSWWGGELPDLRWSFVSAIVTLISVFMHEPTIIKKLPEAARTKNSWLSSPAVWLYLLFTIWVLAQNMWAMGDRHMEFSILVAKFFMLIYLINKTVHTLEEFVSVLVVHILGCAFFGYLGLSHESGRFESAPTPGMSDGNLLSIHMIPFLIAAGYLLLLKVDKKKYYLLPFLVLTLNAVFLTQSRGGLVAMGFAAVLALFFIPRYQRKTFFSLAFMAVIGGSFIIGDQLLERVNTTNEDLDSGEMEKSAASRLAIINSQYIMFSDSPIGGHGHKGTLYLSKEYLDKKWLSAQGYRASHNLTMSVLVDHGFIGFVFYFGAIGALVLGFFRQRHNIIHEDKPIFILLTGCSLAMLACLLGSQFSNSMRLETITWLIGLNALLLRWIKEGKNFDWQEPETDKKGKKLAKEQQFEVANP